MSKEKLKIIKDDDKPKDVVEHLSELRFRFLLILACLIISACAAFYFSDYVLDFLTAPYYKISSSGLNIFNLAEGFSLKLKSSVIIALLFNFPLIILQTWGYIKPAIEKGNRWLIRVNIFFSFVFFYAGCAFAFFMLLPFTIDMLIKFIPEKMNSTINASNYIDFIFFMSASMGAIFELPVIINILTGLGLITPRFLSQKRKYAIIVIWVVAAVITPADVLSQIAVAIPLMFLYEIAILFSYITYRGYKKKNLKI